MSVSYKDAQKEKEQAVVDSKKAEKKMMKEAEKAKKKEEAKKAREEEAKKKAEAKLKAKQEKEKEKAKNKINGKKLMATIDKDKMLLEFFMNDDNKDLDRVALVKKVQEDLSLNLDLLAKFTKQERALVV